MDFGLHYYPVQAILYTTEIDANIFLNIVKENKVVTEYNIQSSTKPPDESTNLFRR